MAGENDLLAVTPPPAAYTRTRAVAAIPFVMPWSVSNAPTGIILVYVALVAFAGAVILTEIVHVPGAVGEPAGTVPFVRLTVRGNMVDTVPPQVVVADPATTVRTLPGNVSDRFTPVYGELVGLRSVIVRVVVPPAWKLGGENALDNPIS